MAKYPLSEIAEFTNAELVGDGKYLISGVADLSSATPSDISYLVREKHKEAMVHSKAGALFVSSQADRNVKKNLLICSNPELAFQKMTKLFHQRETTGFTGIHPTAVIHETAELGEGVSVGPYSVIDKEVEIGSSTTILAGCFIGLGTSIGEECLIYPHVVIRERCRIGHRVVIQPGVIIGACGFGYTQDEKGHHIKLSHTGIVQIDDDVEIGANTCIDRARFHATQIKRGTKIDNLVQIAHNVILGEDNIIAGQTGIAGSTNTGRHVMIGGHTAIAGHLHIEDRTMIAAKSGVSKSLKSGKYGGIPTLPIAKYNRIQVLLRNIERYVEEVRELSKKLEKK